MRLTKKREDGFYELKKGQEIYGEENGIRLAQIVGKYEDIEEELYRRMCRACPNQRMCHDDCEYCDEYLEELEKHDTEISKL